MRDLRGLGVNGDNIKVNLREIVREGVRWSVVAEDRVQ
jgi:hypothetical protein